MVAVGYTYISKGLRIGAIVLMVIVRIIIIAHIITIIFVAERGWGLLEEMIECSFGFRVVETAGIPKFAPLVPVLAQ